MKRKLIEVALPLETINRESAREKSIRHGHPSTLHLWWARRPLAAARAVLFAQLVDDPSSHPDRFPTEEDQRQERERLHGIIERLVVWENLRDERLLEEARQEIVQSCNGNPPPILDPFAGGGTIPLEAQRLGLEAHASDLNPVAVLINKALIEIPPKFRDQPPVFPGLADSEVRSWQRAEGLAADVRAYGAWMREEAEKRLGHLYPLAVLPDGSTASVIAWIWARTVTCPNPACGIEMPLVRSWWLSKKAGREAYVIPTIVSDSTHPSKLRVKYDIGHGSLAAPSEGTIAGRQGAVCIACDARTAKDYVKAEGMAGRMGQGLVAIVAEGKRQRTYLPPDQHAEAVVCESPVDAPAAVLSTHSQYMGAPLWGLRDVRDLFTPRQLTALTTFSNLVAEARDRVLADCAASSLPQDRSLEEGGAGATAYADAVATYLGMAGSVVADDLSSLVTWRPTHGTGASRSTFARQALSMSWDFTELNPFAGSAGDLGTTVPAMAEVLERLPAVGHVTVQQRDATEGHTPGCLISTDPPYYDNIPYADLADFFYVWLRRSLRSIHPALFSTVLVPKAEELVADFNRHGGKAAARDFFESGFRKVFVNARHDALDDFPITVWYAFKQADTDELGTASSGWETLLDGMVRGGWVITATWPSRSERAGRMRDIGANALASSIVLALRPRPMGAPTTDRRGFIALLHEELPTALRKLQQGQIAPVDLPQAAIGPGMAVFSRYAKVLEPDGSQMTVRSALARINEILDQVLSEQEGDFDAATRFAIAWYRQHGYGTGRFGDADNLARARNTSVDRMDRDEILTSRAGKVTLVKPADTPPDYDVLADDHTSSWEALHHTIRILETDGIPAAGAFLATAQTRPDGAVDPDLVKELAFLLFSIAEKNGWTKDAISFNAVAQSWGDVLDASKAAAPRDVQEEIDYTGDEY